MSELWPRLGAAASRIEFEAMRSMHPARLPGRPSHPQQTFAATGGTRVNVPKIIELASKIEGLAIQSGYPNPASPQDRIAFDRAAAETLLDATNMTAFEASQPGVWNFLALVAMPKVTWWRFGSANPERWIASDLTRHMFSRLWWQAFTFGVVQEDGTTDYALLKALSESDLNQLTERKSLGGNHRLVRAIARELQEVATNRRQVLRQLASKIRRLTPFVDFSVLTDEQLESVTRSLLLEAAKKLGGEDNLKAH
jgi:hypothetical protein